VHRDVKPVNVLMDQSTRSVLSDFGIAKVLETSAALTHAGAGVGTPEYMSPEQCRGGAVDARADIYALGVMLYEMLTGCTPFVADNYTALAHSHIYEPVPPPSRINPRISPAVQSVVLKALEKSPSDRFQRATEMATALDQAVAAQVPVAAPARRTAPPVPTSQPLGGGAGPGYPTVLCPNCRQPNAAQQRFCSSCGQSLAPIQSSPPGQYQYPQPTGSWISCPHCRAPNQPISRFCTTCGASLLLGVAPLTCRMCGARNNAGTRFCTACGHPLR
jgi:eukaryotic-like serine/threonine-protein kinase